MNPSRSSEPSSSAVKWNVGWSPAPATGDWRAKRAHEPWSILTIKGLYRDYIGSLLKGDQAHMKRASLILGGLELP